MIVGLSRISVWRCAAETMEPNSFAGVSRNEVGQIAQQPVGVVDREHGVERVLDRAEQQAAHGRQILFVLGNVRRDIDIENDRGEQLLTRRRPMIALAFAGDEQSGGERLAFGFQLSGVKRDRGLKRARGLPEIPKGSR